MTYPYPLMRFVGGEPTLVEDNEEPIHDTVLQCPISNACPMGDARECERYGSCYWEEQEQLEGNDADYSL